MQEEQSEKATRLGKISASGSLYLFLGRILSTIISAIGTIILGSLILQSDYGLFTIALIPLSTIVLFQDWGITYAISRQCAQYRANHKENELQKTIIAGFSFTIAMAVLLTVISILTANYIASVVFNQPSAALLMIVSSTSILSSTFFGISQSIFVGFENMKMMSLISLLQALVQCVTAPVLVILGYGALGAMIGYVSTSIVGGTLSVLIFYLLIYRKLPKSEFNSKDLISTLKPMLRYGVPLSVGTILAGLLIQFNFFTMAAFVKDLTLIGNYKIATNFTVILTFFTFPISTVLFPTFSKINPIKEIGLLRTLFSSSIKYTALIIVPAAMLLMVLSTPIIGALYGGKWPYAPEFLSYLVLINLLVCLGTTTASAFFSALGETKLMLLTNIIYLLTGLPLAVILIPWAGITGMIIGPILAGLPSLALSLYMAQKKFSSKVHYPSSAKIFLASLLSAVIAYLILTALAFSYWIQLGVGLIVFLAMYLSFISLFGALTRCDIVNLRTMFGGFGLVSKVLVIPLALIERLLNIRLLVVTRLRKRTDLLV
jgi:stage V sporulation protein B